MYLKPYHDQFSPTDHSAFLSDERAPLDLVLLHGWGLHSQVWDDIMPELLQRYRVTLIDLPGMGRSPVSNREQTLDSIVDALLPCLPERAVVLGWSLGALIGAHIMKRFPDRVLGLVSVAMGPCFTCQLSWPLGLEVKQLHHFKALLNEDFEGTMVKFLALQCKNSMQQKKTLHLLKHILFFHGLPSKSALRAGLEILENANFVDFFVSTTKDVLFILGEQDALVVSETAQAVRGMSPSLTAALIQGSSHIPFLDNSAQFMKALLPWLRSIERKSSSKSMAEF